MPGEPIRLGPFTGGINHLSDPTALQDTELVEAVNVELDLDGSYVARPPFFTLANPSSGTNRPRLLGYYIDGSTLRLLAVNSSGLWYYTSGAWTFVAGTAGLEATAMVQYDDKAWVVATPNSSIAGGNLSGTTWTSVAAIPRGGSAVIHKERMYVTPGPQVIGTNSTLLKFSDIANLASWPGANQIFINKGDGQKLIDIIVYNDNLLLFKEDSTYVLAFDTSPSDAITRKISPTIGVANKDCVVPYENQLYLLHENNVYEIVNYDFAKLNSKVPLVYDPTAPAGGWAEPFFITIIGDRLVVRYYAKLYVFGLKTKIWTNWETGTKYIGPAVATPIKDAANAVSAYVIGSAAATQNIVYSFRDIFDTMNLETITCKIKTKNYDIGIPHRYKRLLWWGADISTITEITGTLQPIVVNFSVTWDQLATFTWDEIAVNTWDQPLNLPITLTSINIASSAVRKFAKFKGAVRFRQCNFKLETTYDGTSATGPVRFFTFTAIIATKQHVSKALT